MYEAIKDMLWWIITLVTGCITVAMFLWEPETGTQLAIKFAAFIVFLFTFLGASQQTRLSQKINKEIDNRNGNL